MPKQRITKDAIVEAAFELARAGGMEQVLVKSIAERLGCSVQPIYSYCHNMNGLRQEVTDRTCAFIGKYIAEHTQGDNVFAGTGKAFLRLAKEEPNLFKIFILHRRSGVASLDDLYRAETDPRVVGEISEKLTIPAEQAKQLHLHMLIYTIGLGAIFSVTSPGVSADEIYEQQADAYAAFSKQVRDSAEGQK